MSDLWNEITDVQHMLDTALSEAKKRGAAMVLAEAEYYSAKAEAIYRLKGDGMPATLVMAVVKGEQEVAEKMSAYHISQVEYENAREARNVYKKKLDTLREQYAREWSQAGTRDS